MKDYISSSSFAELCLIQSFSWESALFWNFCLIQQAVRGRKPGLEVRITSQSNVWSVRASQFLSLAFPGSDKKFFDSTTGIIRRHMHSWRPWTAINERDWRWWTCYYRIWRQHSTVDTSRYSEFLSHILFLASLITEPSSQNSTNKSFPEVLALPEKLTKGSE